jgi:GTP-binding protein
MPQTKYVMQKSLAKGITPLVVINKCDRESARVEEVHNEIFDLIDQLGGTDEQMDFPVLYASANNGNLYPLFIPFYKVFCCCNFNG